MEPKIHSKSFVFNNMAERVGFEPTLGFPLNTLSKRAPSATRPSLRRQSSWEVNVRKISNRRVEKTAALVLFNSMGGVIETATGFAD